MKKNYRLGICLWASYGLLACTQEVKVYTTSETEIWKQAVVEVQSADGTVPDIVISDEQEQSFDGFGGSFGGEKGGVSPPPRPCGQTVFKTASL